METITKQGKERLEKLIDFIDGLPPGEFDFGFWVKSSLDHCGTICCAWGWAPKVFPGEVNWRITSDDNPNFSPIMTDGSTRREFFGLSGVDVDDALFYDGAFYENYDESEAEPICEIEHDNETPHAWAEFARKVLAALEVI